MTDRPALPSVPRYVTVFVNWLCNLRCRECWLYGDSSGENDWLEEVKREQMSVGMWNGLVDELATQPLAPSISIMGGEPLIHPNIVELVEQAKTRAPGCWIDMSTNGTLLPRKADALVEAGIDIVYISLDGPTPEINNPIRGRTSFARAMAGLQSLREATERAGHGPKIALNFTLTGMNYTALPQMATLAEEHGVPQVTVDLAMYFTNEEGIATQPAFEAITGRRFTSWRAFCNEHQHDAVDRERLFEILEEAKHKSSAVEVLVAPVRYSSAEQAAFFSDDWRSTVRETTCPKLWAQTTILPDGQIISCTPFADTVMGTIKDASLEEVWHGDRYTAMRDHIREQLEPICYRCCELSLDIGVDPELYARTPA